MPDKTCINCHEKEPDYDMYLCHDCAAFLGVISEATARAVYASMFGVGGRGYAVYRSLLELERHQPEKSDAASNLFITISPTITFRNARKLLYLGRLADIVHNIPGDFVECGVGHGETLMYLATICCDRQRHRMLYGFDSFEGFPEPTAEDISKRMVQSGDRWGKLDDIEPLKILLDTFSLYDLPRQWLQSNILLVKGWFKDTISNYPTTGTIAMLHLDCDLYESYKVCLNGLWDRITVGGIIAVDEYRNTLERVAFPGAMKAIDEFIADKPVSMHRDEYYGKWYLRRLA